MGKKYYHQQVDIILEEGSELYQRITALAEAQGHSFEAEVESAVTASLWHHMERNIKVWRDICPRRTNAKVKGE